jgi:hypothetical protein
VETWQDMKDFFFPAVQDTEAAQIYFTVDQAEAWANDALLQMGEYAKYNDLVQTQNTASGTLAYQVGATGYPPYGVWRAEIDDQAIRATTYDSVSNSSQSWETRTGIPRFYYMDQNIGSDYNQYKVALCEKPNGIYELRTYAYGMPARVSNSADTDKVQVPTWAIYGVLWYMLSEAFVAETSRQNLDTSLFYWGLYENVLDRLRARNSNRLGSKHWVYGGGGHEFDTNFWSDLPDTIPEP